MQNFDSEEHQLFESVESSAISHPNQNSVFKDIPLQIFSKEKDEKLSQESTSMRNQFFFYSIVTSVLLIISIIILNEIGILVSRNSLSISIDFGLIEKNDYNTFLNQLENLKKHSVDTVIIEYSSAYNGTEELKSLIKQIKQKTKDELKIEISYNMFAANQYRQQQLINASNVFLFEFDQFSEFQENKNFFCPFSISAQPFIKQELQELIQSGCDSINLKVEFVKNSKELDFCYCDACMARLNNALGFDVRLDVNPAYNQEWQKYKSSELSKFLIDVIAMCKTKTKVFVQFLPDPSLSYINDEGTTTGLVKTLKMKDKQIILEDGENIEFVKLAQKEVKFDQKKYLRIYQRNIVLDVNDNESSNELIKKFQNKLNNAKQIKRLIVKCNLKVKYEFLEELLQSLKTNLSN